jgi:isoquinoline 1-oxidoreductase subunit alpha
MPKTTLNVNGRDYDVPVDASDESIRLLWVLRNDLGLTGTKFGCGLGQCGACAVLIDGAEARSCLTPLAEAVGKKITTIEGVADANGTLHPVQEAWIDHGVPQCGYCQSGQIIAAVSLLGQNPHPTDEEIRQGMAGHLCRCGTYTRIFAAVKTAASGKGS